MLLGGCCESPRAPFRLKDTLPSTLESLTVYGEEGFNVIDDLCVQLQEVLDCGIFPSLAAISLESMKVLFDNSDLKPPYQIVEHKCKARGILFRIEKSDQLRKGGSCPAIWGKTLYMQTDGSDRALAFDCIFRKLRDHPEILLGATEDIEDSDEDLDSEDDYGPHVGGTLETYTTPFIDHTGKTAYMVFQNLQGLPLPPLISFSIYFTHPDSLPENVDMKGLHAELETSADADLCIRLDMFFIPGASYEDCAAHYHGELAARGSPVEQYKMFTRCPRDEAHPLPGSTGQLPGMVKWYGEVTRDEKVLFVCPDPDWRKPDGKHTLWSVQFDQKRTASGGEESDEKRDRLSLRVVQRLRKSLYFRTMTPTVSILLTGPCMIWNPGAGKNTPMYGKKLQAEVGRAGRLFLLGMYLLCCVFQAYTEGSMKYCTLYL